MLQLEQCVDVMFVLPQSGEVGVNSADEGEVSPLHVAAANGHEALVAALAGRGANLNQRTSAGWTPLHQARDWWTRVT